MRTFSCLSNGEQARVVLAITTKDNDAQIDDFGTVVDAVQAASMASSIQKLIRSSGTKRVLIATTQPIVVHYLQPDFVVLRGEVILHPEFYTDNLNCNFC